jgi:hypothetical protein
VLTFLLITLVVVQLPFSILGIAFLTMVYGSET